MVGGAHLLDIGLLLEAMSFVASHGLRDFQLLRFLHGTLCLTAHAQERHDGICTDTKFQACGILILWFQRWISMKEARQSFRLILDGRSWSTDASVESWASDLFLHAMFLFELHDRSCQLERRSYLCWCQFQLTCNAIRRMFDIEKRTRYSNEYTPLKSSDSEPKSFL